MTLMHLVPYTFSCPDFPTLFEKGKQDQILFLFLFFPLKKHEIKEMRFGTIGIAST